MKILFSLVLIFATFISANAQTPDSGSIKIIDANLKVINDYLNKTETSLKKISDAIIFFTELTGIPSESDGKYYAQFHPTKNDLNTWTAWYRLNKDYLFWDKEIKFIVLYKKVKPSIISGVK